MSMVDELDPAAANDGEAVEDEEAGEDEEEEVEEKEKEEKKDEKDEGGCSGEALFEELLLPAAAASLAAVLRSLISRSSLSLLLAELGEDELLDGDPTAPGAVFTET
ncbi:hypothetical protein CYMTET_29376 [Cymbomonas tetramitiformis]|uniref:Uncharacterized protein n=1 Tax=Cymbomonas tetramitiformis TaxID=36881 RepID=A0AAE0FL68_9CHLO|nr:hypothetical protein CYMTET_29376 [Cymbomonas tetramitiformis]